MRAFLQWQRREIVPALLLCAVSQLDRCKMYCMLASCYYSYIVDLRELIKAFYRIQQRCSSLQQQFEPAHARAPPKQQLAWRLFRHKRFSLLYAASVSIVHLCHAQFTWWCTRFSVWNCTVVCLCLTLTMHVVSVCVMRIQCTRKRRMPMILELWRTEQRCRVTEKRREAS